MGVPGIAPATIYNVIVLTFWTYTSGPVDMAALWNDPLKYLGAESGFGITNETIRSNIRKKYNDGGVKLLVSAFGSTEHPTTDGVDPILCA